MKRFPFLLLDAGPIIKLVEWGIWDEFITKCDVTISRTVAEEAQFAITESGLIDINFEDYQRQSSVDIVDVELSKIKTFYDKFNLSYQADIHDGEKETLAFLYDSSENWLVCSVDHVVFRVLGLLGKAEQGISLEEILEQIGLSKPLEWKYTKKFKEKWTHKGQVDFIQDQGVL